MDFYDVKDSYESAIYSKKCEKCGQKHFVRTQEDCAPEYYTRVFVRCNCGEAIEFMLPVN